MQDKSIIEGSRLIAEFMGAVHDGRKYMVFPGGAKYVHGSGYESQLMYDALWDWLMEVVEKIESLHFQVEIQGLFCRITHYTERGSKNETVAMKAWLKGQEGSKIETVWIAIVKFIEWYNKTQSNAR